MPSIKVATWNVNSLRVRLSHVVNWLDVFKPDILALQETKLSDHDFPIEVLRKHDYHVIYSGEKAYNGVAILSRAEMTEVMVDIPGFTDPQRRVLGVNCGDMRIINLYVPNGENILSKKYEYKLNWLHNMRLFLQAELAKYPQMIILGDFNIAPSEIDVHNPKRWHGKVLFSLAERSAFQDLLTLGFHDCFRALNPMQIAYSWWDYRLIAFQRNWGLRIDHILVTKQLLEKCKSCYIDKDPRSWERPSDHVPVVAEFEC